MSQENLSLINRAYAAHAHRDVQAVLELSDSAMEIHQTELLPWGGHYQGHDGLMQFLTTLTQHVDAQPVPDEFVVAGDRIVALGRLHGKVRASSQSFDMRFVHVWTIENGKIKRFEAYIDTPAMLQILEA